MARPYNTLDDLDLEGKTTLLRVDINSPIEDGRIAGTDRIEAAADTVDALADRGARVVILAHQGRKDDPDFTSLAHHARVLDGTTKATVKFVDDVHGAKALAAIRDLRDGEAILLENVRGLDVETAKVPPEEHARTDFVSTLADVADFYVNDAFSAAHRNHASLTGFPQLLPSAAGPTMDRELTAVYDATEDPERPSIYFLGGAKAEDALDVMELNLQRGTVDLILTGGVIGELFLKARANDLGPKTEDFLKRKGHLDLLPRCEALLREYDAHIVTPEDLGVKFDGGREDVPMEALPARGIILDIGPATAEAYAEHIAQAGSLMMNGPAGAYEDEAFGAGTKAILQAFRDSDAFSLLGGGHTITALHEFGFTFDDFGYVSLAGGALMAALTGRPLPAVEALVTSRERHRVAVEQ